jgi:asparagine synthase (glutamine-hydrolysing)
VQFEALRRMAAALRHRGPDGHGLYRDDRVGLAHTRLSILDLTGGAQPVHNEDRTVWVVFNGEIFNHEPLRAELTARGHRFESRCDTEVIVHAFEEWGTSAWERFNGQFAFALWDDREHRLWLVRDRLGILPLFWMRHGDGIVFASEAKALYAGSGASPRFDPAGIDRVFSLWAAPAPGTVFAGVRSVPPGTAISFDDGRRESSETWWQPDIRETADAPVRSLDDAADRLEELLSRAIRTRLRADVPVGAYLSGGLDSSVIADLARTAEIGTLKTFSVRFEDPAFDETEAQRRMAALLGTEHHEIVCGDGEIRRGLPAVVWHSETPLLRTGPVPLHLLSGLVRDCGMKVVLTGEGADELLAGYSIFKEDKVRRFLARSPGSAARARLLSRIHPEVSTADRRASAMWMEFFRRGLSETARPFYSHSLRWENTRWAAGFLSEDVRRGAAADATESVVEALLPAGWRSWSPLARAQGIEMATFLSPYLLSSQGDRVAMGNGVEVRYPFLDPDVVAFCTALPDGMKLRGLRDKVALRRLASRRLPADVWDRPKQPYRAPATRAFFGKGPGDDYVSDLLSAPKIEEHGLVDPAASRRLVDKARRSGGVMGGEREEMALLGMLTLQILAEEFRNRFSERIETLRRRLDGAEPDVLVDRSGAAGERTSAPAGSPRTRPVAASLPKGNS